MIQTIKLPGTFMQICWVVDDLDAAMRHWHQTANVGPFYAIRSPLISDFRYRGAPGTLDMDAALAQAGPIQLELIQPKGNTPSAYRDAVAPGQTAMHHLGKISDDYDEECSRYRNLGFAAAHSGRVGDARFTYFDTRPSLGCMVELIERDDAILEMFKIVADAAVDWDGREPFREMTAPTDQSGPTVLGQAN
jgi:hypothetical protein